MVDSSYMSGRQKYSRPQALLLSDTPGTLSNGFYVPDGYEIGAQQSGTSGNQFIILSDDNRQPISFTKQRIEKRERMINGRMRSYHISDKLSLSTSWNMLPSRSFSLRPNFDDSGMSAMDGMSGKPNSLDMQYTTDGGAGGVELLDWYENHSGSFWVYLAYDKYSSFGDDDSAYAHLPQYNQVIEMFFADFQYSVEKRGAANYDFWNISFSLEEV